ncbi:MAG: right-handed parallel beta-helix repeat-containing protein [Planctomycetes bacterium]|nr:right-handed parallel beta-helix repeat-containing protein [Planctomycetota bacterium]MCW8135670.1 right-handed parallel beta-helix repeat-containing protein [Planctomycetota bacterium]
MRFRLLAAALLACAPLCAETYYADPAAGKSSNPGSKAAPWGALEDVIASGALAKLKPGDTLLLRGGLHGRAVFSGDNADFVTIAAEDGHRPRLSYLEITRGRKWRVRGLTVSASFSDKPYEGAMIKFADGGDSAEIELLDCFVYSTLDTSSWSAEQWMKANSGITMGRHGTGHVVRNCYVMNTRFGINLCAENSLCEGNVISHFSADGIRATRDGQVVQHNVIRNIYVSDDDGDKNHDDAIQVFLFNKGTGTVRNITLRENVIIMRENEQQRWPANMQGIGCFDGPLIGFTVEGNVINTSHWHGVSLYDAQGCKILNNVCYTQWTDSKLRPWVELGTKKVGEVKDNEVKNNHAYSFRLDNDKGVAAEGNLPPSAEIHDKRQKELLAKIDEKHGKLHPVAGFRRTGLEKTRWQEGRVVDGEGGKVIDAIESARQAEKVVVLFVFTRDLKDKKGVQACEDFEREVLAGDEIGKLLDQCATIGVCLDDVPRDLRKRYYIGSKSPQLVIIRPDGTEGYSGKPGNAKALLKQLEAALNPEKGK